MTATALSWRDFKERVERLNAPREPFLALPPAEGPQVFVRVRSLLVEPEPAKRLVRVTLANLGSARARVRCKVFDRDGAPVGSKAPQLRPASLAAGAAVDCELRFQVSHWRALLAGGHAVFEPGELPEDHRCLRLFAHPLLPPRTVDWPIPVTPSAAFGLPRESGAVPSLSGLWVEVETLDELPVTPDPVPVPNREPLRLLIPPLALRYRFREGARRFRDPSNPRSLPPPHADWSLLEPEYLIRSIRLVNATDEEVRGRLVLGSPEAVRLKSDRLRLPAHGETVVEVQLRDEGWPYESVEPRHVLVDLVSDDGDGTPLTVIELHLRRAPLLGAAVRWRAQRMLAGRAEETAEGWRVRLPIENPGTTSAYLRLEAGGRSSPVVVLPPSGIGDDEVSQPAFDLPWDALEKEITVRIKTEGSLAWDPRLYQTQIRVMADRGGGRHPASTSHGAQLEWRWQQVEDARRALAELVVENRGWEPIVVRSIVVYRGTDSEPQSKHPNKVVRPGAAETLVDGQRLFVGRWSRPLRLHGIATLAPPHDTQIEDEIEVTRDGKGVRVKTRHKMDPGSRSRR